MDLCIHWIPRNFVATSISLTVLDRANLESSPKIKRIWAGANGKPNFFFGNCDERDGCMYVCMCVGGSGSVNAVYGRIGWLVVCICALYSLVEWSI